MADCARSSFNNHSSGFAAVSGEKSNTPQSRRGSLPSSWAEVVRGKQEPTWVVRHSPPSSASSLSSLAMSMQEKTPFVDCSATQVAQSPLPLPPENSASAENSDENHVNTAAWNMKPAWNKPSDGVVEVGPAKGAVASPALSESPEASPKFQDESSWWAAADADADASTSTAKGVVDLPALFESAKASPKFQDESSWWAAADADADASTSTAKGAVALPALFESAKASPKFQDESSWWAAADADADASTSTAKGAVASPALSESAEALPKFQDESSWWAAADADADASTSTQVPANLLHPHNHVASNATPNSTTIYAILIRQRFNQHAIHSGNGGGPPHGGFICPSQAPAPSSLIFQVPNDSYGNPVPQVSSTSLREPSYPTNNWNPRLMGGYLPQPHPVNDHHGMSLRGNIYPNMHRNSVHQNNENWGNHYRGSFVNGRNVHMHQQRPHPRSSNIHMHQQRPHPRSSNVHMHQQRPHPRSSWGPSTSSPYMPPTPFFSPQPVRAYGNHMFHRVPFDAFPREHYRGQQFMPQHPIAQSISEPLVSTLLVNQINYYFCDANLVDDNYLKKHMDDQGWVSIHLIAGFPRVKKLTNDIQLILDSLRASTVVEVQGDKIRRRHEWIKWIPNKNSTPTHSLSPSESSQDLLTKVQNLKIERVVSNRTSTNGHEDSIFRDDTGKMKELPNRENTRNANSGK